MERMGEIYIGMVDCASGTPADWEALADLRPDESAKLGRLGSDLQRRCHLAGRHLARGMARTLAGAVSEQLDFAYLPEGKPCFAGLPGWHFSLSHSGSLVACALAERPVGLDIELHKPKRARVEIARRFYAPDEAAAVEADPELFYPYWTIKEAWLKWDGCGLSGLSRVPAYALAHSGTAWNLSAPADAPAMLLGAVRLASGDSFSLGLAASGAWQLVEAPGFPCPAGLEYTVLAAC